jgi:hypothetical protein
VENSIKMEFEARFPGFKDNPQKFSKQEVYDWIEFVLDRELSNNPDVYTKMFKDYLDRQNIAYVKDIHLGVKDVKTQ